MNKIIILLFLTIFLAGCVSQPQTNVTQGGQGPSTEGQPGVTPSQPSASSVSVQVSKYAKFEAQCICDQFGGEEDVDLTALEGKAEAHAREAGFAGLADAKAYGESVPDQEALKRQIAIETQALCPEFMNALNNMGTQ